MKVNLEGKITPPTLRLLLVGVLLLCGVKGGDLLGLLA
jgi:hypothetical protein